MKKRILELAVVLTATFSSVGNASPSNDLNLTVISNGRTSSVPLTKILEKFPNEMIGNSLDYSLSRSPFNDDLFITYDSSRRVKSTDLFVKAYSYSSRSVKQSILSGGGYGTFEEPNVSFVLGKVKKGDFVSYPGLSQYFIPSEVRQRSINSLGSYSISYQYDAYKRLAYNYLLSYYPGKANSDYASLLASFYVMKNSGLDAFYPLYRYELNEFFNTGINSYSSSAWMMKVAASYYRKLDEKGVIDILSNDKINRQVIDSLLSVEIPEYDQLMYTFDISVFQKGFYDYYNLTKLKMIEIYSPLYNSQNCLSILPQLSSSSVLYSIEKNNDISDVCEISKQISKGKISDSLLKKISRTQSVSYIKNGKVDKSKKGSYGALLLSDLSYVVDISKVGI